MAIQLCEGLWALLIQTTSTDTRMIHHTPIATSAFHSVCATLVKKQSGPQLLHGQTQEFPTLCHHDGTLTFSQNSKSCVSVCLIHFAGQQITTFKSFFSYFEFCASLTKESKNQKKLSDTNKLSNARNTITLNRNSYSELITCVHIYFCMTGFYLINAFSEISAKIAEKYFYNKIIHPGASNKK